MPSGGVEEIGDELSHELVDLVADDPAGGDVAASGVAELPVEVALAGEERAGIAAAHRDRDVRRGDGLVAGVRYRIVPERLDALRAVLA